MPAATGYKCGMAFLAEVLAHLVVAAVFKSVPSQYSLVSYDRCTLG